MIHLIRRSYSLTVFSPSGKLVQIEHALAAVAQGTTSLGIKGSILCLYQDLNCTSNVVQQRRMESSLQPRKNHHLS
jgi:20S proteasome alpha/beta subunit